jgi:N-acetylglutamate synthase-like GNAT family acetyltransferase
MVSNGDHAAVTPDEVSFADVLPFRGRAAAEHVSISDTRATRWFVLRKGKIIVAIAGLMKVGSGFRIKGVWVDPAVRGRGLGTHLTGALMEVAEQACASTIEALAYNPAFYEGRGFLRIGVQPNGAIRVRRVL